jgi:hypothetical protein
MPRWTSRVSSLAWRVQHHIDDVAVKRGAGQHRRLQRGHFTEQLHVLEGAIPATVPVSPSNRHKD